ncbi:MAG: 1-deoxy-D-xylulose-5-phosphate reductoisomerase [Betaproteobacteria bacterium]|nr:MAG: 1-deoxy-D-xylulose-5-phosphate reductoisomerase [Betaproteobacteria bacterium]
MSTPQVTTRRQRVALLGATGSIGASTLKVLRQHPDKFELVAVAAQSNWSEMCAIVKEFAPAVCALAEPSSALELRRALGTQSVPTRIESGCDAVAAAASMTEVDIVVAGISGFAGLASTWAAVAAGKRVLLANKEALVAAGRLLLTEAAKSGAELLPIDSEHNAVYQCAGGIECDPQRIRAITLTASGGPFRTRELSTFDTITPLEACKHPTWSMGRKISVDSATLMNKGLEVIEAALLFGRLGADIGVVIHPTSTVHALVEYVDGSVLAHLGPADMQVPIAHALGLPSRLSLDVSPLSLTKLGRLEFFEVDARRYPALPLAYEALRQGQGACLVLNAANEIAVGAFLSEQIRFTDIVPLVEQTLQTFSIREPQSLDDVFALDIEVRSFANELLVQRAVML